VPPVILNCAEVPVNILPVSIATELSEESKTVIYLIVVCSFYTIVHVPPAPNVTVTPDAIDIGPAVITL